MLRKEREGVRRAQGRALDYLNEHRDQVQAYEDACEKAGTEPATVALAWLLTRDGVTAPIIGPRTVDQLDAAVRAIDTELEPTLLDELDAIWPGYEPSPMDYAW